jgi:hypothetical protein
MVADKGAAMKGEAGEMNFEDRLMGFIPGWMDTGALVGRQYLLFLSNQ